ncbi:MAG: hypothetical protein E6679_07810 [Staphylococcus epidermidis]|nr:hypothetical protein [Staphylococcus epidermidis]
MKKLAVILALAGAAMKTRLGRLRPCRVFFIFKIQNYFNYIQSR